MFPDDYVKKCRAELSKKANLKYYHSTEAMVDIDNLRAALGYDQVNIIGTSYGSYFGIVYMKYYPNRVRSAFLTHIAMPNWTYAGTIAPNTQSALERLFADCASDPKSAADYTNLQQKLDQVINRLKQGPVNVMITNPINGRQENVIFTHNNFIHGLRSMLYSSSASKWIPAFIHWASLGYYSPIAEYTVDYRKGINDDLTDGMYLCVTCTETIPYEDYELAVSQAAGTLMGTYRLEQQHNACDLWIKGEIPSDFHQMWEMNIPTLIVSGEIDPVTPPEYGDDLASYLPYSIHVIIPNAAHEFATVWNDCIDSLVAQFISQGHLAGLNADCVNTNTRPPFVSWRDYTGNNILNLIKTSNTQIK